MPVSRQNASRNDSSHNSVWRKNIPARRDRLQARILVWTLGPLLALLCLYALTFALSGGSVTRIVSVEAIVVSFLFALIAWRLGSATRGAALAGGMVCLLLTLMGGIPAWSLTRSGLPPLLLLFVLTFASTRAGKARKIRAGLAESPAGRNAAQVLANLGAAALAASACGWMLVSLLARHRSQPVPYLVAIPLMAIAALAEATADTVSSEIGQAFGGPPLSLITFREVPPGTDGAVSLVGTTAGVLAALLVAATGTLALGSGVQAGVIALAAGIAGFFFDTLLGGTVERLGWIGNDVVNFLSTVFAALLALILLLAGTSTLSVTLTSLRALPAIAGPRKQAVLPVSCLPPEPHRREPC